MPGAWGHAIGGMGSITQAMARACREAGVDIVLNTPVEEVIVAQWPALRALLPAARPGARRRDRRRQSEAAVRPAGPAWRGRSRCGQPDARLEMRARPSA